MNCDSKPPYAALSPSFQVPLPIPPHLLVLPTSLPIVTTSMYRVPTLPSPTSPSSSLPYPHLFSLFIPWTIIFASSQPGAQPPMPISSQKRCRESPPIFTPLDIFITLAPPARPPSTPLHPSRPHNHFPFVLIAHSSLDNTRGHAVSVWRWAMTHM